MFSTQAQIRAGVAVTDPQSSQNEEADERSRK